MDHDTLASSRIPPLKKGGASRDKDARDHGEADVALMLRLRSGNPDDLAAVYDRYGGIVFSLAAKILSDDRESEEATQDVFLSLWKNPTAYSPDRCSPLTWLATITRNKCIDRMRKSGRRISVVPEGFEWNAPRVDERTIDPYRAAALSDLAGSIRECLDRLPPSQRIVLESAYFECLSIDQMAARFNLPYHTIKSRIRLAKEKLRKHLLLNCEGYNSAEGFL